MRSDEWKVLLEEEPDNELVRFSYAKALLDEKSWAAAVLEFERLVAQDPDYVIAWAFLARSALNAGDRAKARLAVDKGLPAARRFGHQDPITELEAVNRELESDF